MPLCYMVKLLMGWDPGISPTYLPYPPAGLTPVAYIPYLPTQTREPNPTLQLYPPYVPNPGRVCVCVCGSIICGCVCVCGSWVPRGRKKDKSQEQQAGAGVIPPASRRSMANLCSDAAGPAARRRALLQQQMADEGGSPAAKKDGTNCGGRVASQPARRVLAYGLRPMHFSATHYEPYDAFFGWQTVRQIAETCAELLQCERAHTFSRAAGSSAASSARRHSVAA